MISISFIVTFPFICIIIQAASAYELYISQFSSGTYIHIFRRKLLHQSFASGYVDVITSKSKMTMDIQSNPYIKGTQGSLKMCP